MYGGKLRTAPQFKEYHAPDQSALPSEDLTRKISALDQVVTNISKTEDWVTLIQATVQDQGALLTLLRLGSKAVPLKNAAAAIRNDAEQLTLLLQHHRNLDLKQALVLPVLAQIANETIFLEQLVGDIILYPPTVESRRQKILAQLGTRTLNLVKSISILKSVFGEYRASLMLEQRAREAGPAEPVRRAKTPALFEEGPDITAVLQGFRNKGWRVGLRQHDEAPEINEDGFDLSLELVNRVKRPAQELLTADTTLGILRFPAVLRVRAKLSDQMIRRCTDPHVGYNVYIVFGGYVAVDNAIVIGIHKDLMLVLDDRGRDVVDTDKFTALVPYTRNQYPDWAEPLTWVRPVQPAKLMGQHYYALLMPEGTMGESRHSISDWSFLSY